MAARPDAPGGLREERTRPLDFNQEDEPRRVGDESGEPLPARRVLEAGMTGGETGRGDVTADDLAPETLIHEDGGDGPPLVRGNRPADTTLRRVSEDQIGAGRGLDEAELANVQPVGRPRTDARDKRRH